MVWVADPAPRCGGCRAPSPDGVQVGDEGAEHDVVEATALFGSEALEVGG